MAAAIVALQQHAVVSDQNHQALSQRIQLVTVQHAQQIHELSVSSAAALASAVAAASAARHSSLPRIAQAPQFEGSSSTIDEWISTICQQFAYYSNDTDIERIRVGRAHLKGPALDWFIHLAVTPTTFEDFVTRLRARFQPITTADLARDQLHNLKQGKQSINLYVAHFRRLIIAIPDMDDASRMYLFVHGLHPSLAVHHKL